MNSGLDGEIHRDTQMALFAALVGGHLTGYALTRVHPAVFLALGLAAVVVPLWLVPDAETVATKWVVYRDDKQRPGEGSR